MTKCFWKWGQNFTLEWKWGLNTMISFLFLIPQSIWPYVLPFLFIAHSIPPPHSLLFYVAHTNDTHTPFPLSPICLSLLLELWTWLDFAMHWLLYPSTHNSLVHTATPYPLHELLNPSILVKFPLICAWFRHHTIWYMHTTPPPTFINALTKPPYHTCIEPSSIKPSCTPPPLYTMHFPKPHHSTLATTDTLGGKLDI